MDNSMAVALIGAYFQLMQLNVIRAFQQDYLR